MSLTSRPLSIALLCLSAVVLGGGAHAPLVFEQGVASGEVTPWSAVLWTRASQETAVKVEVFADPDLKPPKAFQATVQTRAAHDLTAKVRAEGLAPDSMYYYRWRRGNRTSAVGSFRTAPLPDAVRNVRFTFTGDSDGTHLDGTPFFNDFEVLDAVRGEDSDFFIYLGDQIYSDSFVRGLRGQGPAMTLDEYRDVWKENRTIPALPDLLASTSILAIWDDHEVQNDYAGQTVDPARYASGRQAYFEYLPTEESGLLHDPSCAGDPLFKVFHWGSAVDLIILDERSCRSADVEAACLGDLAPTAPADLRLAFGLPDAPPPGCLDALEDPSRTFLGPVQKQAFKDALLASTATFKFVVNELPIQQFYALPYDRWEGYVAERTELLSFIRDNAIPNVAFLATDIHANLVNEVFIDLATDPEPVAQEFVTGPVARTTFGDNVADVIGESGLVAFQVVLLGLILDVDCQALRSPGYGVVEVDAQAGTATVSLKDDTGAVLLGDINGQPCVHALGP